MILVVIYGDYNGISGDLAVIYGDIWWFNGLAVIYGGLLEGDLIVIWWWLEFSHGSEHGDWNSWWVIDMYIHI